MTASASVYDSGYRRYGGPREGGSRRLRALALSSLRRALGLRRSWRGKVVPWTLIVLAVAPAALYALLLLIGAGAANSSFAPAEYLVSVAPLVLVFAAAAGSELVCPERREQVLTLIFTRPVSAAEYAGAKLGVLTALLTLLTLLPLGILLAAELLSVQHSAASPGGDIADAVRVAAASVLPVALYGSVSLAVCSVFERRGLAVVAVVGLFLVAAVVAQTFAALGLRWLILLDLGTTPLRAAGWVLGEPLPADAPSGVGGGAYLASSMLVAAAAAVLFLAQIRREEA